MHYLVFEADRNSLSFDTEKISRGISKRATEVVELMCDVTEDELRDSIIDAGSDYLYDAIDGAGCYTCEINGNEPSEEYCKGCPKEMERWHMKRQYCRQIMEELFRVIEETKKHVADTSGPPC